MKSVLFALILSVWTAPAFARNPVTVIYTSNNRGEIRFCGCAEGLLGGLSRRATYFSEMRTGDEPLFVFDTGDAFFPVAPLPKHLASQLLTRGAVIARAYELLGYDGIMEGELDRGLPADKREKLPWVTAPKVIERGGWKVGVIPYLSPKISGQPETDEWKKLKTGIEGVRKQSDLVIVLAHISEDEIAEIAPLMSGVDIVLLGHSGKALRDPWVRNDVLIFEADSRGQYVGKLRIQKNGKKLDPKNQAERFRLEQDFNVLEGDEKARVHLLLKALGKLPDSWYSHELVPLTERIAPDRRVEELLKGLD